MNTLEKIRLCIWMSIGGLFATYGLADSLRGYRLTHAGIETSAVVTDKRYTSRPPLAGIYAIRYRYVVGKSFYTFGDVVGRTNLWASIPETRYLQTAIGGPLPIRYMPDHPDWSVSTDTLPGFVDQAVAVVLGTVMIALGIRAIRRSGERRES